MIDLNRIRIEGLIDLISEKLKVKINLYVAIKISDGKPYFVINSQELKDLSGVLIPVFKSLTVKNFGGGVAGDKTGYWMPLGFSFDYESGSNGAKIADYWYDFKTNEWKEL
jgi:hypothetical protein